MKHYAIVGDSSANSEFLKKLLKAEKPEELELMDGKVAVFSDTELENFLEEDWRHEDSPLNRFFGRSLRTYSNGEKKKALLEYLLQQEPGVLVLDNPFDSLDRESVVQLRERLQQLSGKLQVLQLFRRKEDLLHFIDEVLQFEKGKCILRMSPEEFRSKSLNENYREELSIPPPLEKFEEVPEKLVEMHGVSVNYEGRPVLQNISWTVRKGEFWQLIGPNGSGKTTLLSMIYGDNPKAYGVNLWLFGHKKGTGETVWEIKKKIGYFSPALTELFSRRNTVLEMLISGLVDSVGLYTKPTDTQLRLAKEWLKTLGFENEEKTIFTSLSMLQQRMVLIARAMIKHPPLLILDEPTTALDDKSARKITGFINNIAQESETAVIFVSHRSEKGLNPHFIYQLTPSENGSEGEIIQICGDS